MRKQPRRRSATLEFCRKLFTCVAPPNSIGGGCLRLLWSAGYAFRELRREELHCEVLVRQGALHILLSPALVLKEPRCMGTFRPACFFTADDGEILKKSELTTQYTNSLYIEVSLMLRSTKTNPSARHGKDPRMNATLLWGGLDTSGRFDKARRRVLFDTRRIGHTLSTSISQSAKLKTTH